MIPTTARLRMSYGFTLALGIGALTLSACTGPQPTGAVAPPESGATAPMQPKVNRVVMAVGGPNVESNDLKQVAPPSGWQLDPLYEYLIGVDATDGKLIPRLATEWAYEPNAVRFKLRKGVQFQRGFGEFTSKDVQTSWKILALGDSTVGNAPYFKQVTREIEAVNDYEVLFHLNKVDANFLRGHSQYEGLAIGSSKHYAAMGEPSTQPEPLAGTSPYAFKERSLGSFIRFERVATPHWRITPDFPEFEYRWVREASTRLAALLTGEVHITSLPNDLRAEAEKGGVKFVSGKAPGLRMGFRLFCCFLNDPADPSKGIQETPLNDARARRALDKAIDRDALNKAFLGGRGETMYVPHFHPSRPGWNPDWQRNYAEESGYDPAKARALLAEAGYTAEKPLTTNIFMTPSGGSLGGEQDMAEAIAAYWKAVGVNVNLLSTDTAEIDRVNRARGYNNHLQIRVTSSGLYTAVQVFHTVGVGGGVTTYVYNGEVEKLFTELRTTLDEKVQADLYRKIGDVSAKNHLEIPLFWLKSEAAINPRFVADYTFPGSISGTWTHVEEIKAAR